MAGSFRTELTNAIRNAFCTALEIQRNYYGYVGETFKWAVTAQLAQRFFDAAYRTACNREPPPSANNNFTGGQCAVNYTLTIQFKRYNIVAGACSLGGFEASLQTAVLGPIARWEVVPESGSARLRIIHGPGGSLIRNVTTANTCNGVYQAFQNISFTSLARADGLPDNCGDPPTVTPTPTPGYNTTTTNITYTNNYNTNITVPVTLIFAKAALNLKGELNIPVRIDLGGVNLQIGGNINLNTGDISLNFGNPNYSRNGLPNPDCYEPDPTIPDPPPGVPDDVTIPPSDQSESETTKLLRGCIVTTSVIPDDISLIYQTGNPNITAPNLGYVSFAINVNGKLAWTSDIPVKNARNFIVCPWEGGAAEVRGTPRPGVSWTITPVYALIEDAVSFV